MQRPTGMLPGAFEAYVAAFSAAKLTPENVVQTVGNAALSAGFHAADGTFVNAAGGTEEYCAAVDMSVRHPRELSGAEASSLLLAFFHAGFCPFWRHSGVFASGPHFHMIWVSCAMKPQLRAQFHDFCHARDGLVSHDLENFWVNFIHQQAWQIQIEKLKASFFKHNPVND